MLTKLYKLIFDLGISCSLGAFLLYYFGKNTLRVGGFVFLIAAASLSVFLKEKSKQYMLPVIMLPIIGGLLLRPAWPELIVYLPVWGYILYLLFTDRLMVGRGEFMDRVRKMLSLCLILPIFMLAELRTFGSAIGAALPYVVTTMVCIVFMLRHLRTMDRKGGQKGYHLQQLWEMMMFLMVCVLLTLARAPQNLMIGIRLLYDSIIRPILTLISGGFGYILGTVIYLINSLLSSMLGRRELSQRNDELMNRLKDIPEITPVTVSSNTWLLSLLYSLGVILALIILFFFFRWLIGDKGKHRIPAGVSETREMLEAQSAKDRHRRRYSKEPAERIRYYYMKYLLHLRSLKITVSGGDTTREIDLKYSNLLSGSHIEQREASKKLKKLYRKARYQAQEELTPEEEEQAKRLYRLIKSQKE